MTARTARTRRPAIGLDASAQLEAVREVLRAISRAPFDLEGVLGIVVERAASLCSAELGMIFVPAGEGFYRGAAAWGMKPEHAAYEMEHQTPITQGTVVGRVVLSGDAVQIEDSASDPMYTWKEGRSIGGYRSIMGVPIRTGEQLIGVVNLARNEVRRFSADEIELVRTFADQAAIVLDNVRLLSTIERQREELARYLPSTVASFCPRPRANSSWPATGGRCRPSSAIYAASPRSRNRPSPRKFSTCCGSTTARWERSSSTTAGRSSTSPATG